MPLLFHLMLLLSRIMMAFPRLLLGHQMSCVGEPVDEGFGSETQTTLPKIRKRCKKSFGKDFISFISAPVCLSLHGFIFLFLYSLSLLVMPSSSWSMASVLLISCVVNLVFGFVM